MDLTDAVQQRAEADRREVDPPIRVETAMWSKLASSIGGERTPGMVGLTCNPQLIRAVVFSCEFFGSTIPMRPRQ